MASVIALAMVGCVLGDISEDEVDAVFDEFNIKTAAAIREAVNPFVLEADQGLYGEGSELGGGDSFVRIYTDPRTAELCETMLELEAEVVEKLSGVSGDAKTHLLELQGRYANALTNSVLNGFFAGLYDEGMIELDDPSVLVPQGYGEGDYPFAALREPGEAVITSDGVLNGMGSLEVVMDIGMDITAGTTDCVIADPPFDSFP